jgi:uncharacterized repeat protein (TIGR01451 family)
MKKFFLLTVFCIYFSNMFSQVVEARLLGTLNNQDLFGAEISVTPDGKYMAIHRNGVNTTSFVLIYKFNGFAYESVSSFITNIEISDLEFSDNGKRLAVVTGGGSIYRTGEVFIYESDNLDKYKPLGNSISETVIQERFGNSFDFSHDGNTFIVGHEDASGNTGEAKIYSFDGNNWTKKGEFLKGKVSDQYFGSHVTISGDGNRIAISSFNFLEPKLEIYDFINGNWALSPQGNLVLLTSDIELSKDGNLLVVGYTGYAKTKFYEFTNNTWKKNSTEIITHDDAWESITIDITSDKKNIIIGSLNTDTQKTKVDVIDVVNNQFFARSGDFYKVPKSDYFGIESQIIDGGSKIIIGQPQFNSLQGQVYIISDEVKTYTYINSFIDKNKNKVKDGNEMFIDNMNFLIDDVLELISIQKDGVYANVVAGQHTVKPILPTHLKLNGTEPITFTSVSNKVDSIFIPIVFTEDVYKLSAFHNSLTPICNEQGTYKLYLTNTGNNDLKVVSEITFDEKMEVVPPVNDAIVLTKNYVKWENTLPTEENTVLVIPVKMPNEDNTGKLLNIKFKAYIYDLSDVLKDSIILNISSTLRCGFDPNDKTATPEGVGNNKLTLKNDFVQYKVRFQNTGNFPTKNISISDDLDPGFDWSTFEVLSASHPLTRTEKRNGKVRFIFANINLPDSATNEALSNGYVIYRIKPKSNVLENTIVRNTADIYFDLNKPIVTNTTINTLVTNLPTSAKEQYYTQGLDIYPNPATSNFFVNTEIADKNAVLVISDMYGKLLWKEKYYNGINISTQDLSSGIYLLQIEQNQSILGVGRLVVVR